MSKTAVAEDTAVEVQNDVNAGDVPDFEATPENRGDFLPDESPAEEPVVLDKNAVLPEVEEEAEEAEVAEVAEEPEVKAEPEKAEEPEKVEEPEKEAPHMIPKSRLDNQIQKTRELEEAKIRMEEQMKFLQAQVEAQKSSQKGEAEQPVEETAPAYDYGSKYKQMQELTLDGEADKAAEVFQEILSQQQTDMTSTLNKQISATYEQNRSQEQVQAELASAANEIIVDYPELDIQNESTFDSRLTGEVNELMTALTTIPNDKGQPKYTPAQALKQAVAMKMPPKQEAPKELGAEATPETGNIEKKVEAANKQVPKLPGDRGTSHGKTPRVDPLSMTEEDFDALPASTLARLRGDI
jgi:hypothetical protein